MSLTWSTTHDPHDAPTTCGVYEYWTGDTLLYIGKAVSLKARLLSHAQNAKLDAKEAAIVAGDTIRYTLCDSEFKALLLESELIRTHRPPHNRVWKDDKTYLYIVIDLADSFPRPRFARAHELKSDISHLTSKLKVFGPFPSGKIAEEVLRAIRRLIPFCMARKVGKHACFYSRIGLCSPCPSVISSKAEKSQYRKQIRQVIRTLEGNIDPVIKTLTTEMKAASAREDFETALKLRTKIERFERFITTHSFTDRHFSYNDSSSRLESLQNLLSTYYKDGLCNLHRIECYDASNNSLEDSVVSLVVMKDGLLDKGEYRRFKIKNPRARSDFDRLDEAITRRLKSKTWDHPDLIVIDGGTPQLRRLQRIFDQLPDPPHYLGLAKHPDRLVFPTQDGFSTIKVGADHPGLQLLEQLRDEAHRFANSYRKILAKKRSRL
jgi:excinuclease ABC subunit C